MTLTDYIKTAAMASAIAGSSILGGGCATVYRDQQDMQRYNLREQRHIDPKTPHNSIEDAVFSSSGPVRIPQDQQYKPLNDLSVFLNTAHPGDVRTDTFAQRSAYANGMRRVHMTQNTIGQLLPENYQWRAYSSGNNTLVIGYEPSDQPRRFGLVATITQGPADLGLFNRESNVHTTLSVIEGNVPFLKEGEDIGQKTVKQSARRLQELLEDAASIGIYTWISGGVNIPVYAAATTMGRLQDTIQFHFGQELPFNDHGYVKGPIENILNHHRHWHYGMAKDDEGNPRFIAMVSYNPPLTQPNRSATTNQVDWSHNGNNYTALNFSDQDIRMHEGLLFWIARPLVTGAVAGSTSSTTSSNDTSNDTPSNGNGSHGSVGGPGASPGGVQIMPIQR